MFYRIKRVGRGRWNPYGQIVESYREDGKVKQRVILYVGHYATVDDALERMPKDISHLKREATKLEKRAASCIIPVSSSAEVVEEYRKRRADAESDVRRARERAENLSDRLVRLREIVVDNPGLCSDQHSDS